MITYLGLVMLILGLTTLIWPRWGYAFQRNVFGVDQGRLVTDWALADGWARFSGVLLLLFGLGFAVWGGPSATPKGRTDAGFHHVLDEALGSQWDQDQAAVQALRAKGEDTTVKRRIEFTAEFPTESNAQAFLEAIRLSGFEPVSDAANSSSRPKVQVRAWKEATLDEVPGVAFDLGLQARQNGGRYLGWK